MVLLTFVRQGRPGYCRREKWMGIEGKRIKGTKVAAWSFNENEGNIWGETEMLAGISRSRETEKSWQSNTGGAWSFGRRSCSQQGPQRILTCQVSADGYNSFILRCNRSHSENFQTNEVNAITPKGTSIERGSQEKEEGQQSCLHHPEGLEELQAV